MSKIKTGTTLTTAYQVEGDTTGALVIQTGATPTTAVTIGADQSVTFAQPANLPNTFGFKNRIINGNMRVAQRGNLILSNNGTTFGGPDRFFLGVSGFSTVSVIALQAGAVFSGTPYTYQVGNLLTTGGPGTVYIAQRIESANTYDLNSNTVTFSLQVLQQSGAAVNAQLVIRKANAADNFSGTTLLGASTATSVANNTSTTLTYSLALGSSDASNGLQVELYFPSLAATTNAQIYTANWQFEKGAVATSFDVRPYGTELNLCQRYYQRFTPTIAYQCYGLGEIDATNAAATALIYLLVTMRASPSCSASGTAIQVAGSVIAQSSPSFTGSSPVVLQYAPNSVTGTAGQAFRVLSNNTLSSYIDASAELS